MKQRLLHLCAAALIFSSGAYASSIIRVSGAQEKMATRRNSDSRTSCPFSKPSDGIPIASWLSTFLHLPDIKAASARPFFIISAKKVALAVIIHYLPPSIE